MMSEQHRDVITDARAVSAHTRAPSKRQTPSDLAPGNATYGRQNLPQRKTRENPNWPNKHTTAREELL